MDLINKKENQITFTAEIDESLANAVRKYLNKIPILAVDEVEISKNDSALYDETIAHRIGLIPIKMDKSISEKKTYKMKLDVFKEGAVLSKNLSGDVKVVYDEIPITNLNKNQELKLTATLISGRGNTHAKFSPGLMFYRNVVDAKIEKDCPKEIAELCPKELMEKGKKTIMEPSELDALDVCAELCKKKGKDCVTITPTKELVVTVESFGQLEVKDVFKKSLEELKKDLEAVSKEFK